MSKPLIGISAQIDYNTGFYKLVPDYANSVIAAGGLPLIIPFTDDETDIQRFIDMCDGFIVPGGHDILPDLYGESDHSLCGAFSPERDGFEPLFVPLVIKSGKPFLGICRGMQMINVICGGTLYRDIFSQTGTKTVHRVPATERRIVHTVSIKKDTPLFDIVGKTELPVNSAHHQAIKMVGEGLKVAAESDDGIIEAVYMPGRRFSLAVQWHPEMLTGFDEASKKIFSAFIDAAR